MKNDQFRLYMLLYHFKKYEIHMSRGYHRRPHWWKWDTNESLGIGEGNFQKGNRKSKGQVMQKQIQENREVVAMATAEGTCQRRMGDKVGEEE